jgi:trans-aconitate 2-methyltransferase
MTPHDWNASDYDATNAGIIAIGLEVMDRLDLTGSETVLDAGCGTGVVTEKLLERLPTGFVYALDASPQMVEHAEERFASTDNVEVVLGDLNQLDLEGKLVDAVFSTATLHWILDHENLFRNFWSVLKPGGRLVAQCGGDGNIAEVQRAYLAVAGVDPFNDFVGDFVPTFFADPDDTERRLLDAGFAEVDCWLEDRLVTPDDLGKHLREVILGAHMERLPENLHEPFAEAVEQVLGDHYTSVEYVRLNIDATA